MNPSGKAGTNYGIAVGLPEDCDAGPRSMTVGGLVGIPGSIDHTAFAVCKGKSVEMIFWTHSGETVAFDITGCGRTRSVSLPATGSGVESRQDISFIC